MFLQESAHLVNARPRGKKKPRVRTDTHLRQLRRALNRTATELCRQITAARPDQNHPFTCRLVHQGKTLLCRTNGLFHIRLFANPKASAAAPTKGVQTDFVHFKAELNNRFRISGLFGNSFATFNERINTLPAAQRLPILLDNLTCHLP